MRFLIVVALMAGVACAAPLHDEPELDGTAPPLEDSQDHDKAASATPKKDDAAKDIKTSEQDSDETKDNRDQNELEIEEAEYDEQPDGVEMIAVFAMKVQPAQQSSLFEYPMVLPFGIFQRPDKYVDHRRRGAVHGLDSNKYPTEVEML